MAQTTPDSALRRFSRSFDRLALRSAALLVALGIAACVSGHGGHWHIGHHLDHERQISFDPELDSSVELTLELDAGEVRVVRVDGPSRLVATVHEEIPGSADLHFEGGHLMLTTQGKDEAMVGELLLELSHGVESMTINIGAGELLVDGIDVRRGLVLATGAGEITLRDVGAPRMVDISQGAGDLELRGFETEHLNVDLGAGSADLHDLWVGLLEIDSGIGSISIVDCTIDDLRADAGIGDIDVRASDVRTHSIDSGIGSVSLGQ
ncbi:DUF4097 family beta strand repeat-containing protein [Engelhardtia mirabilis]|uniref:DUF4097 domain-containing protein n=1 Tax=Engelhardtia mirabilis TaxID=2528011 RepID=A0A518BQV3_9BACT|nr:hypothetical protein Pla133_44820 [Planctomycetes bacterium Pla133]QDV03689.1 hypothetical protein Pla86_44800 [Planctomycetes bacterium Pla86]